MSIIYVKGNLLNSDCNVICHGCNCFNIFGAGIAGGNWNLIEQIINKVYLKDIYVYKL